MKLKPEQRLTADVAEARALSILSRRPVYASQAADVIWPDHSMKAQGAGAAASRILKRLERRGLCRWIGGGWVLTVPDAGAERG
jgi:hypothetical protein